MPDIDTLTGSHNTMRIRLLVSSINRHNSNLAITREEHIIPGSQTSR